MMKTASLKVVDATMPPPSNRDALASAIAAQLRLEGEVEKNQQAVDRAQRRIGDLEASLAAARADIEAAKVDHAEAVTKSLTQDGPIKKSTALRDARAREAELLDDLEAAQIALANFERTQGDREEVEYFSDDEIEQARQNAYNQFRPTGFYVEPPAYREEDRIKSRTVIPGTKRQLEAATRQTAIEADDVLRREVDLDGLMAAVTDACQRLSTPCAILSALLRDGLLPEDRAREVALHMAQRIENIPYVISKGQTSTTWSKGAGDLASHPAAMLWRAARGALRTDANAELPKL